MPRLFAGSLAAALFVPALGGAQISLPGLPDVPCLPPTPTVGAAALAGPFALAYVGDTCVDLSGFITESGKLWTLRVSGLSVGDGIINSLTAVFNPDPFITFGASTTNVVAGPVTYAFLFGTPIVPGFYTTATSTGGVSVTSGATGTAIVDNSAVYPTYISGYGTVGAAATNLGVDLGTAPCQAGPGAPAGSTTTCNQGNAVNVFAPTFYDNLEALLTYTQTDVASVASWSGAVTLNGTVVPEPATVTLVAAGLVVLAFGARRRT